MCQCIIHDRKCVKGVHADGNTYNYYESTQNIPHNTVLKTPHTGITARHLNYGDTLIPRLDKNEGCGHKN